jgi:PAS domain S-box-containing protein
MRLLVVDDHEVVRRGVRSLLQERTDYQLCGEAIDGQDAVEKARELKPDVIVMDVSMPRMNGLEATRIIRAALPDCEVLVLSQHEAPEMARQALRAGARGYVVKSSISKDLITALGKVSRREYFFDPAILERGPAPQTNVQEILQRSAAFERALRESEQLYRSTFELAAVGVAHTSPDGRWLRVNRKYCEIVGYSEQELQKLTFQNITHPDDLPFDLAQATRVMNGEIDTYSMEKRYIRKDGSLVWVSMTISGVRDAEGRLKHFIAVVEDISARKLAEDALRRSEERLRLAQQVARIGSFDWDIKTGVSYWTPELESMYGLPPGSFPGTQRAWEQLIHPDDYPEILRRVDRAMREGDFEGEWRVIWPDGSVHWLLGRASVFRDKNGKPERMVGINIEISDRKPAGAGKKEMRGKSASLEFASKQE